MGRMGRGPHIELILLSAGVKGMLPFSTKIDLAFKRIWTILQSVEKVVHPKKEDPNAHS